MIKFIYPEKDTFISNHPTLLTRNFGKDEILEIENRKDYIIDSDLTSRDAESRALIKFNTDSISQSIVSGDITDPTFILNLKISQFDEVPQNFSIIANPISQSWTSGTGRYADEFEKTGVSWIYRFAETQSWSEDITSIALNGGTWYDTIQSQSISSGTASIEITNINIGDTFFITSSIGEIYTYTSDYTYSSSSKGYASASMEITSMMNFDRFVLGGSQTSSVSIVNKFTPDTCGNELFIGWNSDMTSDASTSIEFTTASLYAGKKYVLYDSIASWSFIASTNTDIPDLQCGTRFFYVNNDNYHNVTSFSLEINSVDDFNISSSVSMSIDSGVTSSFLIVETVGMGELGNDGYFLDQDDYTETDSTDLCGNVTTNRVYTTQSFDGSGSGTGNYSRFGELTDALSSISSSHGVEFNTDGYTIFFTASISGSDGELFSFTSGSTTVSFGGAYESHSFSLKSDDISTNLYYFDTGSVLTDSIDYLISKVNDSVEFVDASRTGNFIILSGSIGLDNMGFQSGSSQVTLDGSVQNTTISSSVSQSFINETTDLRLDITDIVNSWLTNQIPNEGIILKSVREVSDIDSGKIRFYSMDTNTIYVPRIEVQWNDQSFDTGNLSIFSLTSENLVRLKSVKQSYKNTDIEQFRISARTKYPSKTYSNQFDRFTLTEALPMNSQYAIKDEESEEFIINFSEGTKISCDASGSFFNVDMSTLPQERYCSIYIKVIDGGLSEIYESRQPFKISR